MNSWLAKLWRRKSPPAAEQTRLPPALDAALECKQAHLILPAWQTALQQVPECFDAALAEAQRLGWSERELHRLRAYGHYYRGEIEAAFELARDDGLSFDAQRFNAGLFLLTVSCLYYRGQFDEAWRALQEIEARHAAVLHGRADFWQSKAALLLAKARLNETWQALTRARELAPEDAGLAMSAYALAFDLERWPEFAQLEQEIAAGRYGEKLNAFALAKPYLMRHDYRQGFALLEGRYRQADAHHYVNPALPAERRCIGRAKDFPAGKTLLLTCEQGFGDTLMMARYWPLLHRLTEGRLIVEVQSELLSLMQANFPAMRLVARAHGQAPPVGFDFWLGAMSLPYFFDHTAQEIPGKGGFLVAPEENLVYWRSRLAELAPQGLRVGLAWSGNPRHLNDGIRSIPFALLASHLAVPAGLTFIALQTTGLPSNPPAGLQLVSEELVSYADTAALIALLDLVITVDTSVVHLAGSLGKETWLLFPYRYEWRWGLEGETNCWYDTVKVLRQSTHGAWAPLLDEVFHHRLLAFCTSRQEEKSHGMV